MAKQPDIVDVWTKLREIDDKLDRIRGHVNVLATLNKEQNKDALLASLRKKLGSSLEMQRLWYYADAPRTILTLQALAGVKAATIGKSLSRLHERGLLNKNELQNPIVYYQDEVSQGLGLERWVEAEHKKKNLNLTPQGAKSTESSSAGVE